MNDDIKIINNTNRNLLDELKNLKNEELNLESRLKKQSFNVGDNVKVLSYETKPNASSYELEYQLFDGIITKNNYDDSAFPNYHYSVDVEDITRTQFDKIEMMKL